MRKLHPAFAALAALFLARWALGAIPFEREDEARIKAELARLLLTANVSSENARGVKEEISRKHERLEKQWRGDRLHPSVDEHLRRAENLVDWRARNLGRLRKEAARLDLLLFPDEALAAERSNCDLVTADLNEGLKPAQERMRDAEAQSSQDEALLSKVADDLAQQAGTMEVQAKEIEARLGMASSAQDAAQLRLAVLDLSARFQAISRDAKILAQSADDFAQRYEEFEAGYDDFAGALSQINSLAAANKNHEAIDEIEDAVRQSTNVEPDPDPPPEDSAIQVELLPETASTDDSGAL